MSDYSGEERRRRPVRGQNELDHDTLTKLDVNVTLIGKNLESFMQKFEEHVKEDSDNFKGVNRYIFIGVGIIAAMEFFSKFIK